MSLSPVMPARVPAAGVPASTDSAVAPRHRADGRARLTAPRTTAGPGVVRRSATATGLAVAAVVSTAALSVGVTAEPAAAYPAGMSSSAKASYERQIDQRNYRVLKAAQSLQGVKYRYGGTTPSGGFDCSGFVRYVYAKVNKPLPRTSGQMASAVHQISRASVKTGDLVFFRSGGRVYHVAIYAGNNNVWHAPGTGERVKLERIWTSNVTFGRV
ncbi:C40 family peptidase [Nocardioides sp. CPCC 205120]|uniref:C40 family peptidase n=1 Tax=Nocardioides sp. CPCC 205120 TaxID=3406462 RepID=UPI003B5131E5